MAMPSGPAAPHEDRWLRGGDSWHGSEYMCFWEDKLSYVSNVSGPAEVTGCSPYLANHFALSRLSSTLAATVNQKTMSRIQKADRR